MLRNLDNDNKAVDDMLVYDVVGLVELYNLSQHKIDLFDLRSESEYKLHHIIGAKNMSQPMNFKQFNEDYQIVLYGNKNSINKNICNYLYGIAKSQQKEKRFCVFMGEYIHFYNKHKYLCISNSNINDNDDNVSDSDSDWDDDQQTQYPNMILKDRLYLGDCFTAENTKIIVNLKFTHIVNVTRNDFELDDSLKQKVKKLQLYIDDSSSEKISKYFDKAHSFIDQALKENNTNVCYVHCMAGISRSSSIIISYLMKSKKISLFNAYLWVKRCRPKISPNTGFFDELVEFEKTLFNKSTRTALENVLDTDRWKYDFWRGHWI